MPGGPAANGIPVRAAWTATVAIANRYVKLWWARDQRDVALIFLGTNNFGHLASPQGVGSGIAIGDTLVKFGRGISAYAQRGTPPAADIAAVRDGQHRNARFNPSRISQTTFDLPVNPTGQVGNGGDSGGPDRAFNPTTGAINLIVGVQSTCNVAPGGRLPGHPATWDWVTQITLCTSVNLGPVANEISEIIWEGPTPGAAPCSAPSQGCGIVEITKLLLIN